MSECSCGGAKLRYNMVFACSGASDVGGITDGAARQIGREKKAMMSCSAGVGAGIQEILDKASGANQVLAIDGCDKVCTKVMFEKAGLNNFIHLQLGDLGFKKGESPITEERIQLAASEGKKLLSNQSAE
jgi:uncharacterized metal-binding protein